MKRRYFLSLSLVICFCLSSAVFGASRSGVNELESYYFPYVSGNVLTEYNFSSLVHNNAGNKDEGDKKSMGYLEIESNLNFHIMNRISIRNKLNFRPVQKRYKDDENSDYYGEEGYLRRKYYFNKYDAIFEELVFQYQDDQFLLGFGKYNPTFGTAYDKSKYHGVFDTRVAEDYELDEKIGFYVGMILPMFNLRFNSFFSDDTFMSRGLLGNRDRYDIDGVAGNTGQLNNFSITADFAVEDLKFNVGFKRLSVKGDKSSSERGYAVGVEKLIEETESRFGFIPFAEFSYTNNYRGTYGRDKGYLTIRLPLFYGGWSLVGTYSGSIDKEDGFKDYKNYLAQFTIGYKFDNGIMIDASKSFERETYKDSATTKNSYKLDSWGLRLSYMLDFDRSYERDEDN